MGLLPILILFLYCSLGSAVPAPAVEVDCDDLSIFDAVDEALKSYNEAKVDGNQFILYRITEAKLKHENDSLTHEYVNFEIQESVCPLKNGTPWKQCDYKSEDPEIGECSAHILVNTAQNTKTVLSKNCSILPKVEEPVIKVENAPCLGCPIQLDPANDELSPYIQSAIENVNKIANHPFYFKLENVTYAERQVVSGWIYKLKINIIQTNCSKSSPLFEECTADLKGDRGNCLTRILLAPNGLIRDIVSECYLSTGFCLHCPVELDVDNPDVLALTEKFIKEYNLNSPKRYNVVNVTKATRKTVLEKKQYELTFTIQAINCSKSTLGEKCPVEDQSIPLACDVSIDVVNETSNIQPGWKCSSNMQGRIATVKGFSPLRSVPVRGKRASEKSKGKEHGNNHHKDEKHGKPDKKDHKKKKNHDKKKDKSSEESEEDHGKKPEVPPSHPGFEFPRVPDKDKVTQKPITTRQPSVPPPTSSLPKINTQSPTTNPHSQESPKPDLSTSTSGAEVLETLPTINEEILDFPIIPPPSSPKCPSKVWQPLLIIPKVEVDEPFVIGGLSPSFDDLALPEDQNQPTDLNTDNLLLDEDLLAGLGF